MVSSTKLDTVNSPRQFDGLGGLDGLDGFDGLDGLDGLDVYFRASLVIAIFINQLKVVQRIYPPFEYIVLLHRQKKLLLQTNQSISI